MNTSFRVNSAAGKQRFALGQATINLLFALILRLTNQLNGRRSEGMKEERFEYQGRSVEIKEFNKSFQRGFEIWVDGSYREQIGTLNKAKKYAKELIDRESGFCWKTR